MASELVNQRLVVTSYPPESLSDLETLEEADDEPPVTTQAYRSVKYGKLAALALVLCALAIGGGVVFLRSRSGGHSHTAASNLAIGLSGQSDNLTPVADIGDFGNRLSDHTNGKDWTDHICEVYSAISCTSIYVGDDAEIAALNSYYRSGTVAEKITMEGVMTMSKDRRGVHCEPCVEATTTTQGPTPAPAPTPAPTPDLND